MADGVLSLSRTQLRESRFDQAQRMALAEDDLDNHDAVLTNLASAVRELKESVDTRLQRILWAIMSTSFTITAAAIAYAYASSK